MGIPGWGLALGALLKGPEYINTGLDLYKNIRDSRAAESNEEAARASIDNLAWAAQEEDPNVRLENYREISRDMGQRPLKADTALALQGEVDKHVKAVRGDIQTQKDQAELSRFQQEAAAEKKDLITYAMERPDKVPLVALEKANGVFSTLSSFAKEGIQQKRKEQEQAEKTQREAANLNDFAKAQNVAASYLLPNQGRQQTGRYQPAAQVRADVSSHLADFALDDKQRNTINTMIDKGMEDTWVDGRNPYTGKADQEVLTAQRAEESAKRQEEREAAAERRANAQIAAADRRAARAQEASDRRSERKDAAKMNRPLPAGALTAMASNHENLRRAETALDFLEGKNVDGIAGDKDAIGWKGYVPDTLLNRLDPKGTSTRAAIADLGSLVIHDRSGAAVTASEHPRLKPFIPLATDDAVTAKKKLRLFVRNYKTENEALRGIYKESGYRLDDEAPKAGKVGKYSYTVK